MQSAAAVSAAALLPSGAWAASAKSFGVASEGIAAQWSLNDGRFRYASLRDRIADAAIPLPLEVFALTIGDRSIPASVFSIESGPLFARERVDLALVHRDAGVRVRWSAIAPRSASYLRQELLLEALAGNVDVREVRLFDFAHLDGAYVAGNVDGSPIVSGRVFAAVEHPLAKSEAIPVRVRAWLPRSVPLRAQAPLKLSSVIGATRRGQLRRDFLTYIERERARPYSPFLHYNSWYDIGYFTRYDQTQCLDRIHAFGEALYARRGVTLKSFLFDDGWDDPDHLWHFNAGFPQGFAPLKAAAARYGAAPGAWLSPWGGYGKPRRQRLASARRLGFEIDADGLALSGPKYYRLFSDVVERFIRDGGVNHFKIDGTGSAQQTFANGPFGSDFEAAIALIARMRAIEPDIYVNLTTGTYPSPFWLRYCDSIWRGGDDHDFAGVGTDRQRWITYRDADTYAGIVSPGPLFPLNSLMLHGLIYAQRAERLSGDPFGDFPSEVHSYFATGTQLQEMYCTPDLLSQRDWDEIARWAKWAAANASILRDTHWIGGNPDRLEVYGWAAWSVRKGIITLRNPNSRAQEFPLDIDTAFELPEGAAIRYRAGKTILRAGAPSLCKLQPFEVRTIEAFPENS